MSRSVTSLQTATLALAASAFVSTGALAESLCPEGADSKTCVTCLGQDTCTIDGAHGDSNTRLVTIELPAKHVSVAFTTQDRLYLLRHEDVGYSAFAGPMPKASDGARSCTVDVWLMPRFVPPPAAPARLAALSPKPGAPGTLAQHTTAFGPYSALDSLVKTPETAGFELSRRFITQNIYVNKTCTYKTRPEFTAKRWNAIKVTILPQNVSL